MPTYSQNDLVVLTEEIETEPGTVVGGARERAYFRSLQVERGGSTEENDLMEGGGEELSDELSGLNASLQLSSLLQVGSDGTLLNSRLWETIMRDTWDTVADVQGATNISCDPAGTRDLDGASGPIITAAAGTFDNFVNAAHNGEQLMLEASGWGDNQNNQPAPIENVKSDGSQLDMDPTYYAGSAGDTIGAPMILESNQSPLLRVGKGLRNGEIEDIRRHNFEWQFPDQPSGNSYGNVLGWTPATFKLSFEGKKKVMTEFGGEAHSWASAYAATIGNGTVNDDSAVSGDMLITNANLLFFVINGTTQIQGQTLTSYELNWDGKAEGVDDVAGSTVRTGVTVGKGKGSGSIKLYHSHAITAAADALARAGTHVPIDWKIKGPGGHYLWIRQPKTRLMPGGPTPGSSGKTDGTYNFSIGPKTATSRSLIIQFFGP